MRLIAAFSLVSAAAEYKLCNQCTTVWQNDYFYSRGGRNDNDFAFMATYNNWVCEEKDPNAATSGTDPLAIRCCSAGEEGEAGCKSSKF